MNRHKPIPQGELYERVNKCELKPVKKNGFNLALTTEEVGMLGRIYAKADLFRMAQEQRFATNQNSIEALRSLQQQEFTGWINATLRDIFSPLGL